MKKTLIVAIILAATTISYGATQFASYPVNINGQALAAKPINVDGTTYLPIRAVAEALGTDVEWTGQGVDINTVDLDRLKEACVMLQSENNDGSEQGSGVYIDYGEILTANHVVHDGNYTETSDGIQLKIDKQNAALDVATLKCLPGVKPCKIGDSDEVDAEDEVIVVSAPDGKNDTVMSATVSSISTDGITLLCNLASGSSGGAVFNVNGELIGILIRGNIQDTEYLVVPINKIRESL